PNVRQEAILPESQPILQTIQEQWADDALAKPDARRIPFRVVLSEFARDLADGRTTGLMPYLTWLFSRKASSELTTAQFEALLNSYPSILILDGLDEVPASTNREDVLAAIRDFWADI